MPANRFNAFTDYGIGIGLRVPHYAHILEQRRGRRPDRLLLYWTGEPVRKRALMSFEYQPDDVVDAVAHFDKHPVTVSMTKEESSGFSHL